MCALKAQTRKYVKYFALDELTVSFDRFDGTPSPDVERAVLPAGDAVIVLPYNSVKDLVLVVEQMRIGSLARGDRAVWQLEPVSGRHRSG